MRGTEGASRISSVRGLNDSPQTATVRPFMLPKWPRILARSRVFCSALTVSTARRIWKS
ncbi:hypothetical protein D3C83_207290 [compost metagenome]